MRRFAFPFLIFLFGLQAAIALELPAAATVSDSTALWESASSKAAITGRVAAGTEVTVTNCHDAWCEVSGDGIAGHVLSTHLVGGDGITLRDANATAPLALEFPPSTALRMEGDSYMGGRYGSIPLDLAKALGREQKNTAKGGSSIEMILARMADPENAGLLDRIHVIWDGSHNGLVTVEDYADKLASALDLLDHDRFVLIPAMYGASTEAVRDEFLERWPENVVDWRDILGDFDGSDLPADWRQQPDDPVHPSPDTKRKITASVAAFIRHKGW